MCTGEVDSFNGRTGDIVPIAADYDAFFLTQAEGDALYNPLLGFTPSRRIIYKSTVLSGVNGTTNQTAVTSGLSIAAGTIQAGDIIQFHATFAKSGTAGATTLRFYMGTADDFNTSTQIATNPPSATTLYTTLVRKMLVLNPASSQRIFNTVTNSITDDVSNASANSVTAFAFPTTTIYFNITIQNASAADTVSVTGYFIEIIR